ncbi:FBP domain-containing protein [Arsenicicoccus sp. oral taxon 190]|uniref:FBP domain-containing protein n=1 Tax=Arsenicicoccus sp. oral taxon 190 TaxID=1658671 RepID=UPI00067A158A|nr:FBP domain-containing protein [Arsenicicoccus sp. oral taxon 190]AKT51737.1 hypothetical protein ADJ73_11375 [Arsenicicoccus sp. oral taxon 190]
MRALTEPEIRAAFVNASRREAAQAVLPDLDAMEWSALEVLGWRDPKRPLLAYVVLVGDVGDEDDEGAARAVLLRPAAESAGAPRRRKVCSWCQDITETEDVTMYVARRAGAAGRAGSTVGTLICTDFSCSRNVRRAPTPMEVGAASAQDRAWWTQQRVDELRLRSLAFLGHVLAGDEG